MDDRASLRATIRVIRRAQKLVEQGFTRKASARDRHGNVVNPLSKRAHRFCAVGALQRAWSDCNVKDPIDVLAAVQRELNTLCYSKTYLLDYSDESPSRTRIVNLFADTVDTLHRKLRAQ